MTVLAGTAAAVTGGLIIASPILIAVAMSASCVLRREYCHNGDFWLQLPSRRWSPLMVAAASINHCKINKMIQQKFSKVSP
jgi:hypothetical protein